MITDLYFVDCENVGVKHVKCDKNCSRVFYFHRVNKLDDFKLEDYEHFIFVDHDIVKNALDFIIDSCVGYEIRNFGKRVTYHIISKDKGFNILKDYWGSLGFKIVVEEYEPDLDLGANFPLLTVSDVNKITNVYEDWARSSVHSSDVLKTQINRLSLKSEVTKSSIYYYLLGYYYDCNKDESL